MSRSYLVEVYKTKAVNVLTLHNSWGSKTPAWDFIYNKIFKTEDRMIWFQKEKLDTLYDKLEDVSVPSYLRTVLFICGWRCCLNKDCLKEIAKDVRQFSDEISPVLASKCYVNHWPAIADFLENYKPKARAVGLALHGTSVDDEWEINPSKEHIAYYSELLNDKPKEAK